MTFEDARGAWLLMLACSQEMQKGNGRRMSDIEIEQRYKDAVQILNEYFVGKKIEETMEDGQ